MFSPLPSSQCGREWARPHHPTPHWALYSVHPQHVRPQAVSGVNLLFVCLFVCGTLKYAPPPLNTAAELLTPALVTYTLMLNTRYFPFSSWHSSSQTSEHLITGTRDPRPGDVLGVRNPLAKRLNPRGPSLPPYARPPGFWFPCHPIWPAPSIWPPESGF